MRKDNLNGKQNAFDNINNADYNNIAYINTL